MRGRGGVTLVGLAAALALAGAPSPTPAARDWTTPAEQSGFKKTPHYEETIAFVRRIAAAARHRVAIEIFGKTGEGRDLVAVVASGDGLLDPAAVRRAGRPVVLIQNAIHAGEMDGKDACLMLLRDMVVGRERADLLKRAVVVIIPIYNIDGHERFGPFNRINQNGPEEIGWRTQAANLNLNRDYLKADAPETRAFLKLWNRWLPDFFVDTHVTDGADFAYDTTYALDTGPAIDPALAAWERGLLTPYLEESVGNAGHVVGPYVSLKDDRDPAQGLTIGQMAPRFSTGYTTLQNRIGLLIETHMLKDYKTRVTGTYEILRAALEVVNREADALVRIDRQADAATIAAGRRHDPEAKIPLRLESDRRTEPFLFHGRKFEARPSEVSGGPWIVYSPEPLDRTVPRQTSLKVALAVAPPAAYIVPAQWSSVIDVLRAHDLAIRVTSAPWSAEVETYRCEEARWLDHPFEGRQVLFSPGEGGAGGTTPGFRCRPVRERLSFPAGSAVVPLDQRAARVAIEFLEPEAPDSAVAWGFFNAIFEQKEYAEPYVMETTARDMLARDPGLKAEFEHRLAADPQFAASPEARLDFFYRRSPYWDDRLGLYPVGRLATIEGIPLATTAGIPRPPGGR